MSYEERDDIKERMVRIETKLDMAMDMIPKITDLQVAQARAEESASSAHHRIDNIYKIAGLISTIISVGIGLVGKLV